MSTLSIVDVHVDADMMPVCICCASVHDLSICELNVDVVADLFDDDDDETIVLLTVNKNERKKKRICVQPHIRSEYVQANLTQRLNFVRQQSVVSARTFAHALIGITFDYPMRPMAEHSLLLLLML